MDVCVCVLAVTFLYVAAEDCHICHICILLLFMAALS